MKKVLQVMDGLGRGGVQTFVMNNIEELYNNDIICDFMIRRNNSVYTEEIEKCGGKIILTAKFPQHILLNWIQTKRYLKKHSNEYCAIHVHANALLYLLPLKFAKKYGIPIRIVHSHNTQTRIPILKSVHLFNRKRIGKLCTNYFACGKDAGEWMFGKQRYDIIKNCIDEKKFGFNEKNRAVVRHEFSISDSSILIGHVGAINRQKNHTFIIDIFKEYLNIHKEAKLILFGVGDLEDNIKQKVKNLGLEDNVIFAGARGDIYKYYHAMDAFLFPSLFEGLPFSLIEAQMTGLPSLVSDVITDECVVTNLIYKMSLEQKAIEWAYKLEELVNMNVNRIDYSKIVSDAGYGIKSSAKKLADVYNGR